MSRALLALALLGCGGAEADLRWSETWELLAPLDDGSVLDVRMGHGNTGLLRGQGHLRMDWWSENSGRLAYERDVAPGLVEDLGDDQGLRLGLEHLEHADRVWELRVASPEVNALARLEPEGDPVPADPGDGWTTEAVLPGVKLTGWVSAGRRGGMIGGHAVLLRRAGDAPPTAPRQATFVLGRDVSLGLDLQGERRLAWLELDGTLLDASDARMEMVQGQPVVLDFRPAADVQVRIKRRKPRGSSLQHQGLLAPERWLLKQLRPNLQRTLQPGVADVRWGERRLVAPAVLLEAGPEATP